MCRRLHLKLSRFMVGKWRKRLSGLVVSGEWRKHFAKLMESLPRRSVMRAARTENPTYEDVCSHETGHAEVVEVEFDPARVVSYDQLLDVFWSNHNPTTLNRQGPDVGDQYRSVIFYHSPEQQTRGRSVKRGAGKERTFPAPDRDADRAGAEVLSRGRISSALSREARSVALRDLIARRPA